MNWATCTNRHNEQSPTCYWLHLACARSPNTHIRRKQYGTCIDWKCTHRHIFMIFIINCVTTLITKKNNCNYCKQVEEEEEAESAVDRRNRRKKNRLISSSRPILKRWSCSLHNHLCVLCVCVCVCIWHTPYYYRRTPT